MAPSFPNWKWKKYYQKAKTRKTRNTIKLKIQEIEKEIVQSFQELKVDLLNQTETKKNLAEEKLEKLKVLLVKLNKKQDAKKNFLDDFNNFLTPKISFKFNPYGMKDNSSETRTVGVSDIFSTNRLGLSNTFEEGRSLTLGLDYRKEKLNLINP